MAVIITDMEMPKGCFECPLREEHGLEGDWCAVSEGCDLIGETTRPNYCPLKSADEMIAEIEEIAQPNLKGGRNCGKSVRYGMCLALDIIKKHMESGDNK